MDRSLVGDLINFRGLVYSPMNENGVVFLFGKVIEDLNMYIEEIKPGFPDCIGRRFTGKGWERVRIEFEYKSKNFVEHGHNVKDCDLIVCWEHDWDDCPIEVIELKDRINDFPNKPITRPDITKDVEQYVIGRHFNGSNKHVVSIFEDLDKKVKSIDDNIYRKIAKSAITYYSPERVFAYTYLQKNRIKIDIFTGGESIVGVKNFTPEEPKKGGSKWGQIYLSKKEDLKKGMEAMEKGYSLIKNAIKNNERTGWYAPPEDEIDWEI